MELSPSMEASTSIAARTPDKVRLNDPDADLVAALRRRDERALMALVRRYGPMMLRVARSYVGSELAADVVQETWIAVLRGVDGFGHRALFKTWLIRILVNAACSRRARERRAVFWSPLPEEARSRIRPIRGRSSASWQVISGPPCGRRSTSSPNGSAPSWCCVLSKGGRRTR